MLAVGQIAPDFTLLDQDMAEHSLSDYRGSWALLYFYPKDDTPGCTTEACALRDNWQEFREKGIVILGVSIDSPKSHQKFLNKYALPFALLADEEKKVVKKYNVWQEKIMFGRKYMGIVRTSFLVDPTGTIAKIYSKVKPAEHAAEVLRDVELVSHIAQGNS